LANNGPPGKSPKKEQAAINAACSTLFLRRSLLTSPLETEYLNLPQKCDIDLQAILPSESAT
jgi:hypothetical protein